MSVDLNSALDFWEYQHLGAGSCIVIAAVDPKGKLLGLLETGSAPERTLKTSRDAELRPDILFTKKLTGQGEQTLVSVTTGEVVDFPCTWTSTVTSFFSAPSVQTNIAQDGGGLAMKEAEDRSGNFTFFDNRTRAYWQYQDGVFRTCKEEAEATIFQFHKVSGFVAVGITASVILGSTEPPLTEEDAGSLRFVMEAEPGVFTSLDCDVEVKVVNTTQEAERSMISLKGTLSSVPRPGKNLIVQVLPPEGKERRWTADNVVLSISWDRIGWFDVQGWEKENEQHPSRFGPRQVVSFKLASDLEAGSEAVDVFKLVKCKPHPYYDRPEFKRLSDFGFQEVAEKAVASYLTRVAETVAASVLRQGGTEEDAQQSATAAVKARWSVVSCALDKDAKEGGYWGMYLARQKRLFEGLRIIMSLYPGDLSCFEESSLADLKYLASSSSIAIDLPEDMGVNQQKSLIIEEFKSFVSQTKATRARLVAAGAAAVLVGLGISMAAGPLAGAIAPALESLFGVGAVVAISDLTLAALVVEGSASILGAAFIKSGVRGISHGALSATPSWTEFAHQAKRGAAIGAAFGVLAEPLEIVFEAADFAWYADYSLAGATYAGSSGLSQAVANRMAGVSCTDDLSRSFVLGGLVGVLGVGSHELAQDVITSPASWVPQTLLSLENDVESIAQGFADVMQATDLITDSVIDLPTRSVIAFAISNGIPEGFDFAAESVDER